jgi:hypothetical protein
VPDSDRLNDRFPVGSPIPSVPQTAYPNKLTQIADAFKVYVDLGPAGQFVAPSHLFGKSIIVIPYGDTDGIADASGGLHRGDEGVARCFPPGDIGFAIKHHRPMRRVVRLGDEGENRDLKENIKLQDTHIAVLVGVRRGRQDGVVMVNSPQNYKKGGFGSDRGVGDYPMIFVRPLLPGYVPAEARKQFLDNIRLIVIGLNAVTVFPDDYNGADPLSARTPQQIRHLVRMMIKANAGDQSSREFFGRPENRLYCAEFAFVATSAGLIVPMNDREVAALGVSDSDWQAFKREITQHNRHDESAPSVFVTLNQNRRVQMVDLPTPESLASLKTISAYAGDMADEESRKLAFKPMTTADIIETFMRVHFPRKDLGERIAPTEAAILQKMKPGLFEMMGIAPDSEAGKAASKVFDEVVTVVGRQYEDYDSFRQQLEPVMDKARRLTGPRGDGGEGLFVPPSLFHVVLSGEYTKGGLIQLQYVGHGLHYSLVRPE